MVLISGHGRKYNTKENIIDEQNKAPDKWSVFEDSMCCPQDPSTLKASIILGEFLQIQKTTLLTKDTNEMHPILESKAMFLVKLTIVIVATK